MKRYDLESTLELLDNAPKGVLYSNKDGTNVLTVLIRDFKREDKISGSIHSYLCPDIATRRAIIDMKKNAQTFFMKHPDGDYPENENPYLLIKQQEAEHHLHYQDVICYDDTHVPAKIHIEHDDRNNVMMYSSHYDQGYATNYRDVVHFSVKLNDKILQAEKINLAKLSPQANAPVPAYAVHEAFLSDVEDLGKNPFHALPEPPKVRIRRKKSRDPFVV